MANVAVAKLDRPVLLSDKQIVNRELIRQYLSGRGPFVIRTSDGKEYRAPHPEFVLVGRHNVVIETNDGMLDIIDPLHIVSIRPGTSRKTPKGGA